MFCMVYSSVVEFRVIIFICIVVMVRVGRLWCWLWCCVRYIMILCRRVVIIIRLLF